MDVHTPRGAPSLSGRRTVQNAVAAAGRAGGSEGRQLCPYERLTPSHRCPAKYDVKRHFGRTTPLTHRGRGSIGGHQIVDPMGRPAGPEHLSERNFPASGSTTTSGPRETHDTDVVRSSEAEGPTSAAATIPHARETTANTALSQHAAKSATDAQSPPRRIPWLQWQRTS